MNELLGVCLKGVGDHHEQDHAECGNGLCDSISKEDVHPTDLLREIALGDWAGVGEDVENDSEADVQHDYELYHEQETTGFLDHRAHDYLKLSV